jgi:hypothetical protein
MSSSSKQPPAPPFVRALATLDAVVDALYASISGPPGERDWDLFRALFVADARLGQTVRVGGALPILQSTSVEEFVAGARPYLEAHAFHEREIARKTDAFGCIAHVFSTYEARHEQGDPEPFARGINSIQLFHDGERWWIANMIWDDERPGSAIPAAYLPGDGAQRETA